MTEREQALFRQHLAPCTRSFWKWSEDGTALLWDASGRTIAFRQEVASLLDRLAPRGLPPFGAVVLLLAACRDGWMETRSVGAVLGKYKLLSVPPGDQTVIDLVIGTALPLRIQQDMQGVLDELDRLALFPSSLRGSISARAVLAETVFPAGETLIGEDARATAKALAHGFPPSLLAPTGDDDSSYARLEEEIEALRTGLPGVEAEAIRSRMRTSLDGLPGAAELEEDPIPARARRLMAELRDDEDLAGVAQLAQHVLAALQMPRVLQQHDDLPVGGVSDITNRGTFDRLLLSELAQDDLTLTVRVALNEALYFRRETPAKSAPLTRTLLLDTGLRMWGLPRVYGVAVALALVASAPADGHIDAFTADGAELQPLDLASREGLCQALERLQATTGAADALPALLRRQRETEGRQEMILITHPDAVGDASFAAALSAPDTGSLFTASVTRQGTMEVCEHSAGGQQTLSRVELDVAKILKPNPARTAALPPITADGSLPAFLQYQPVPIRLPVRPEEARLVESEKYLFVGVTASRRLVVYDEPKKAARELVSALPKGVVLGTFVDDLQGTVLVVLSQARHGRIGFLSVRLDNGASSRSWISAESPQAVWYDRGVILLLHQQAVDAVFLATLSLRRAQAPAGTQWLNGRYYGDSTQGWYAACATATGVGFEKLCNGPVWAIIEGPDESPWCLRPGWKLAAAGESTTVRLTGPEPIKNGVKVLGQTHQRVVFGVHTSHGAKILVLDWKDKDKLSAASRGWEQALQGSHVELARPRISNVRLGFSHIGLAEHTLALRSKDGRGLQLMKGGKSLAWKWQTFTAGLPDLEQRFTICTAGVDPRPKLREARWQDGSVAFLDSRGLLHLVSSDSRLPQITLTLTLQEQAGWLSDGRAFGSAFFLDGPASTTPGEVADLIQQFVRRLR